MVKVFERIAYGRDAGLLIELVLLPLQLIALLYGLVVRVRHFLYSRGIFETKRLSCGVISVGNLTVGGTGKTPTVEFIAKGLLDKGHNVAVVSRGYGRAGKGIEIVSDGNDLLLGPDEAGDEPYLLARRLKGVPVLVGSDRYEVGVLAVERFNPDIIILDDGLQHIRLHRDLDVVLVDGERGFGNGRLFPRGPLREPADGVRRAGIIIINREPSERAGFEELISDCRAHIVKGKYRPESPVSLWRGENVDFAVLKGKRIVAISAIANPSSFSALLSSLGMSVIDEVAFRDHHPYTHEDLSNLIRRARALNAEAVITTEKDAVKLERLGNKVLEIPIYYLPVRLDIGEEGEHFFETLLSNLK